LKVFGPNAVNGGGDKGLRDQQALSQKPPVLE
jgi:hypothetical protein